MDVSIDLNNLLLASSQNWSEGTPHERHTASGSQGAGDVVSPAGQLQEIFIATILMLSQNAEDHKHCYCKHA